MDDPNRNRDSIGIVDIGEGVVEIGADVAAEGIIDSVGEIASGVIGGIAEVAGEAVGGILDGLG